MTRSFTHQKRRKRTEMNHSGDPSAGQPVPAGGPHPAGCVLGLMAKHWTPGNVKTRLGRSIGMQRSARLHALFVRHLCLTLKDVGSEREFVGSPSDALPTLERELPAHWKVVAQSDGDLGERMKTWFRSHLACTPQGTVTAGTDTRSSAKCTEQSVANRPTSDPASISDRFDEKRIVLIGADCPTLSPTELERSFDALADHDVVLGPAADGGYYLVGISSRCVDAAPIMFDVMTWSNSDVLAITRDRLRLAEINFAELPVREDVDTIVELHSLRDDLNADSNLQHLRDSIDQILASEDSE